MSQTYAILPSPRHVESALRDTLAADVPEVNRFGLRTGTEPGGLKGWFGALIIAPSCCLAMVISGCGSGFIGSTSGALQISPGTVDFGDVGVGQVASSNVTISNQSLTPIAIAQMSVSAQPFSVASTDKFPISIPPGGTHTVSIGFTPVSTSDYSADLTVMDLTAHPIAQVAMHGRGAGNQHLTVTTSNLSFGDVALNTATMQSLTLTSTGTLPVTVNSAEITGTGFSIVGASFPITLNPSQSTTLQVQFKPMTMGGSAGQVAITSDSSSGNTAMVSLSGIGAVATAATTNPVLSVSASSLNFGIAAVNTASPQAVTLTSTGTSPVTVNSATITGTGFSIAGATLPATLNPGQTLILSVQFKPTTAGTATAQIAIKSNSSTGSTTTVSLNGTGVTPTKATLSVSTASLSFGSMTVNTAATKTLTLSSTGTSAVTVSGAAITGAGFTIVGGSLPVTLNPAQTLTLSVQFKPTAAGATTGQLTISSNSNSGATSVVSLSGTGAAAAKPVLAVSAASLSFGSVTVNSATTKTLTLSSTGTSAVTVSGAAITGAGFTIVGGSLPATLNPGQTLTLSVQSKPTATGAVAGQLTISSNSSSGATSVVTLSGTGVAAAKPILGVSAASLSFGSVTVNTATTKTLTLSSTGTSAVTVNSAAITGAGFTIVGVTLPTTLNPGQTLTLQVQFKPTATGAVAGQFTISSNSSSGVTSVMSLSGTGTAANPIVSMSATSLNFGSIAVNTTTTKTLILSSTGPTPVTVNSAAITGAGFIVVGGSFPVTLNPAQTLTLQLQFKPTTAGAATGQITISSNSSSGSSSVVTLSGTGTAVPHEVDLSWSAPSSSTDPVVGYNIYRALGSGSFQLMNTSRDTQTTYVDNTVISGSAYNYMVKSVDSSGVESVPSNQFAVTIP